MFGFILGLVYDCFSVSLSQFVLIDVSLVLVLVQLNCSRLLGFVLVQFSFSFSIMFVKFSFMFGSDERSRVVTQFSLASLYVQLILVKPM